MASIREIRRRIRSVKSTSQITRAMEMVAAVKMRRAQSQVLASRPYSERLELLLRGLAAHLPSDDLHPLLQVRPVNRVALVLVTADRGLCGPINANAVREAATFVLSQTHPVEIVVVGRRGRDWMVRRGQTVVAEFSNLGDRPSLLDVIPIARIVTDGYARRQYDEVVLVYNQFISTTQQRVVRKRLLPIVPAPADGERFLEYIYEPSPAEVLSQLLPRFVEVEIYQTILEALASEQSARMVAMHNATENARDMIQSLTLTYNKARQAGITREILEIASGAEALRRR